MPPPVCVNSRLNLGRADVESLGYEPRCFYKAWFPLAGKWLTFKDVHVVVDPSKRAFDVRLRLDGSIGVTGKFAVTDRFVLTAVVVNQGSWRNNDCSVIASPNLMLHPAPYRVNELCRQRLRQGIQCSKVLRLPSCRHVVGAKQQIP